jgi:hypothetical protein
MTTDHDHDKSTIEGDSEGVPASETDWEILGREGGDDVNTDDGPPEGGKPERKGRQNRFLKHQTERNAVRGQQTRRRVIELHVMEGKTLVETAEVMGIHLRTVQKRWKEVLEDVKGGTAEELREEVRAYADLHLREVIQTAQQNVDDSAAYGAVVVQGIKTLCELHGVEPPEETKGQALTMEEVGQRVRSKSPLLLDKLNHIRAAKRARKGGEEGE